MSSRESEIYFQYYIVCNEIIVESVKGVIFLIKGSHEWKFHEKKIFISNFISRKNNFIEFFFNLS